MMPIFVYLLAGLSLAATVILLLSGIFLLAIAVWRLLHGDLFIAFLVLLLAVPCLCAGAFLVFVCFHP